jgi:hypothetical protein
MHFTFCRQGSLPDRGLDGEGLLLISGGSHGRALSLKIAATS